jgi:hypothetical protein
MYLYAPPAQARIREDERWQKLQESKAAEDERLIKQREDGIKAKKNASGAAYDICTLQYQESRLGEGQKYADDMGTYVKYGFAVLTSVSIVCFS